MLSILLLNLIINSTNQEDQLIDWWLKSQKLALAYHIEVFEKTECHLELENNVIH